MKSGRFRFLWSRRTASGISTPRKGGRKFSTGASAPTNWTPFTVCRGYVEAQKEYASEIHDDSGVNQYAQKIFSTPGKQDGLYWKNPDGTSGRTDWRGGSQGAGGRLHHRQGRISRLLLQDPEGSGPGGAYGQAELRHRGNHDWRIRPRRRAAEYRVTGVKTFIVSNDGIVYQKDLGPDSLNIVKKMELYNPDKTWQPTDDQWPQNVAVAKP